MKEVFLSYSTNDNDAASVLCTKLDENNISYFLAKKDVKPGQDFSERIRAALISCRVVCLLATPQSMGTEWVTTEWGAAWVLKKPLVTIYLDYNVNQLPARIQQFQCVAFHEFDKFVETIAQEIADQRDEELRTPSEVLSSAESPHSWRY